MGKFISKIVFFCSFLLAAALVLQLLISYKIKELNLNANDNFQDTEHVNSNLLLMGSSRCWAHFNPAFFENTFKVSTTNIGISGHSEIPLMTLRLENYLATNKAPKYAILNLDPFVEADATNSHNNFVLKDHYARYAFFPQKKDEPILDFLKFTTAEKYMPLYAIFKYKLLKDCLFPQKKNYYTEFGYEKNNEHWDTLRHPVVDVMKKHLFTPNEIPALTAALQQLQAVCRKNNIQLLCIQTPVYKVIYDKDIFAEPSKICSKLGIPFVDASIPAITNDINCFYNSNHLNTYGVLKMNAWLKNHQALVAFFE